MHFYIEVVGPYDGKIIGPFKCREHADAYNEKLHDMLDANVFDTYILDQATYDAKVAEFGPIEVELP